MSAARLYLLSRSIRFEAVSEHNWTNVSAIPSYHSAQPTAWSCGFHQLAL